jgi:HTH-type transcriptional regulator / antitoxin HipB
MMSKSSLTDTSVDYPVPLVEQLQQLLKSLRRSRGLTQAVLAQRLGVVQSRVADIERDPSAVSTAQLIKVLAALDAELVIRERASTPQAPTVPNADRRGQW